VVDTRDDGKYRECGRGQTAKSEERSLRKVTEKKQWAPVTARVLSCCYALTAKGPDVQGPRAVTLVTVKGQQYNILGLRAVG
jgi:hypothetical protein